jgi:hypothetical protein
LPVIFSPGKVSYILKKSFLGRSTFGFISGIICFDSSFGLKLKLSSLALKLKLKLSFYGLDSSLIGFDKFTSFVVNELPPPEERVPSPELFRF